MSETRQELISAYLDGELSADEQDHVERLLAEDAGARQLLDELRAMSGTLQCLPRHKVGEDLAAKVLRRAERAVLAPQSAQEPPADRDGQHSDAALMPAAQVPAMQEGNWRAFAWAGAAVAAALLLMVFTRGLGPDGLPIARAPEPEDPRVSSVDKYAKTGNGDYLAGEGQDRGTHSKGHELDLEKGLDQSKHLKRAEAKNGSPRPDGTHDDSFAGPSQPGPSLQGGTQTGRKTRVSDGDTLPGKKPGGDKSGGFAKGAGVGGGGAGKLEEPGRGRAALDPNHADAGGEVLLVHVDITAEAARAGAVDQFFAGQQIQLNESKLNAAYANLAAADIKLPQDRVKGKVDGFGVAGPAEDQYKALPKDGVKKHARQLAAGKPGSRPSSLEMVYVEATPAQVESALVAFSKQPQNYSIAVTPGNSAQKLLADKHSWRYAPQLLQQREANSRGGESKQLGRGKSLTGQVEKIAQENLDEVRDTATRAAAKPGEEGKPEPAYEAASPNVPARPPAASPQPGAQTGVRRAVPVENDSRPRNALSGRHPGSDKPDTEKPLERSEQAKGKVKEEGQAAGRFARELGVGDGADNDDLFRLHLEQRKATARGLRFRATDLADALKSELDREETKDLREMHEQIERLSKQRNNKQADQQNRAQSVAADAELKRDGKAAVSDAAEKSRAYQVGEPGESEQSPLMRVLFVFRVVEPHLLPAAAQAASEADVAPAAAKQDAQDSR